MTRITEVCGAAFIVLGLLRVFLTVRGRRSVVIGKAEDGTTVSVRKDGGVRELVLARAGTELVQSRSDGGGYVREFHRAMRVTPRPQRILFLGGGACIGPMQFEARYADATIDVVESSPLVVEAAKRYFGFRETARLKLHIADARAFLATAAQDGATRSYDLVILDIYDAHGIPPDTATAEFFASIRAVLRSGGTLVANLIRPADKGILATVKEVFPAIDVQDVTDENALVFASVAAPVTAA